MHFPPNSKILLVGEGNFSFAVALCQMKYCSPKWLVATCLEEQKFLTPIIKQNIQILRNKGVPVLMGIDGRKLKSYFAEEEFSIILFNFPHCGGKMKIQNNRQLLKEFFRSAEEVLIENGMIYVTLCRGQGGIPLDEDVRKWTDSWQVVSMATCANLILSSVSQFNPHIYEGYHCSGYRSLEKGFHQDHSVLYKFIKCNLKLSLFNGRPLDCICIFLDYNQTANVPIYLVGMIQRYIFDKKGTFLNFTFSYIIDIIIKKGFKLNIFQQKVCKNNLLCNFHDFVNGNILNVFPALVLNEENSLLEPFILIQGLSCASNNLKKIFCSFYKLQVFNKSKSWSSVWKKWSFFDMYDCWEIQDSEKGKCNVLYRIHLEKFANYLFNLEDNEIWRLIQTLGTNEEGVIIYDPYSYFPPKYRYHLSFWLTEEALNDLSEFHLKVNSLIINTVQSSLVTFNLLQSFTNTEGKMSETYEIFYCSYDTALSKTKALGLHNEVGRRIQCYLGCEIR